MCSFGFVLITYNSLVMCMPLPKSFITRYFSHLEQEILSKCESKHILTFIFIFKASHGTTWYSLQGARPKWTDLSHHAQLRMCTSRAKMAASWMKFSAIIQTEFVVIVSWKLVNLFFHTKFLLVWLDNWRVNFNRPKTVFAHLGQLNEWLVRTLKIF